MNPGAQDIGTTLYTVGHGTLPAETFTRLLTDANVGRLADVRSFPGSRRNPQFGREEMQRWLPLAGVSYIWMRDLGGRRPPVAGSEHVALRHQSFRAYADYMETPAFLTAATDLVTLAAEPPTAVMCSESVWWQCHRRLLADYLMLVRGCTVLHLLHNGRLSPHVPTQGVRCTDNALIYDVGSSMPRPLD